MNLVLAAVQILCLISLRRSEVNRRYPILSLCLLSCIPATFFFRSNFAWLNRWYILLTLPVAVFRLLAALEIAHRQTEGFRGWPWLMPTVWAWAAALTGVCCLAQNPPLNFNALNQFVELRRIAQLWEAYALLFLEAWWIWHMGLYRSRDWLAIGYTIVCLNHGVLTLWAMAWGWTEGSWPAARLSGAAVDAVGYGLMAITFRRVLFARLVALVVEFLISTRYWLTQGRVFLVSVLVWRR